MVFLVMLALGQMLVLPVFLDGVFVSHDLLIHWNWSRHFSNQFWGGELYPRWLAEMNGGRGSPAFFFYGPLAYWATALLTPLAADPTGWLALGLSFGLAAGLSGATAYLWLKTLVGSRIAFWGSLVYLTLPYHLSVDLLYRFGLAEMWALAWGPLVLYGAQRVANGGRPLLLGIGYALLILTHPPTTIIVSMLLIPYGLFLVRGENKGWGRLGAFGIGLIWGLCLAAFYVLPILETMDWVSLGRLVAGIGDFSKNFIDALPAAEDPAGFKYHGFRTYLGTITLYSGVLLLLGLFSGKPGEPGMEKQRIFWGGMSVLALFLMTSVSLPAWENLFFLRILQFPWRFHVLLILATAVLLALGLQALSQRSKSVCRLLVATVLLSNLFVFTAAAIPYFGHPIQGLDLLTVERGLSNADGTVEYLPRWVPDRMAEALAERSLERKEKEVRLHAGQAEVAVVSSSSRTLRLQVFALEPSTVEIFQFYFPLWQAESEVALPPLRWSEEGHLLVGLPRGDYALELVLRESQGERLGRVVSLVALTLIPLLGWRSRP